MMDEFYISMIHKHLREELSEGDQSALDEWLNRDPEHLQTYRDIEAAWKLSEAYLTTYSPDVERGLSRLRKRIREDKAGDLRVVSKKRTGNKNKPFFSFAYRVAAGLLLLFGAFAAWNSWFRSPVMITASTGAGERQTIELSDGSSVILNERSTLVYPRSLDHERQAQLSGEAYFDIAGNPDKPFTITTAKTKTEVLGTSFNLRAYTDEFFTEVEVSEGLVRLADNSDRFVQQLGKGKRGVYQHMEDTILMDTPRTLNATFWKDQRLRFRDHPLLEAINEINDRLDLKIQLVNQSIATCPLTLSITLEHPDTMVASISDSYNASWRKTGRTVYAIEGGKCPDNRE